MIDLSKATPRPWTYKDVPGAGLEIYGPVGLVDDVELPLHLRTEPDKPINIFGMTPTQSLRTTQPITSLIAYERLVQFEPKGWHEMQVANTELIISAVNERDAITAERDRLRVALAALYEDTASYIKVNHLGDVHHNRSMILARDALAT